jgi:hypothetical protein
MAREHALESFGLAGGQEADSCEYVDKLPAYIKPDILEWLNDH